MQRPVPTNVFVDLAPPFCSPYHGLVGCSLCNPRPAALLWLLRPGLLFPAVSPGLFQRQRSPEMGTDIPFPLIIYTF